MSDEKLIESGAHFEKLVIDMLTKVIGDSNDCKERICSLEVALKTHAENIASMHQEVKAAFPAGDIEGHRRYHQAIIEWSELRNKIVREVLINAGKVGFIGGLVWVAVAIWHAFKMELTR